MKAITSKDRPKFANSGWHLDSDYRTLYGCCDHCGHCSEADTNEPQHLTPCSYGCNHFREFIAAVVNDLREHCNQKHDGNWCTCRTPLQYRIWWWIINRWQQPHTSQP